MSIFKKFNLILRCTFWEVQEQSIMSATVWPTVNTTAPGKFTLGQRLKKKEKTKKKKKKGKTPTNTPYLMVCSKYC